MATAEQVIQLIFKIIWFILSYKILKWRISLKIPYKFSLTWMLDDSISAISRMIYCSANIHGEIKIKILYVLSNPAYEY